jgi:hypothetical protein
VPNSKKRWILEKIVTYQKRKISNDPQFPKRKGSRGKRSFLGAFRLDPSGKPIS